MYFSVGEVDAKEGALIRVLGIKTMTTGYDFGVGNDGGISVPWYSFSFFFFVFSPSCNLYAYFATINNSCLILFVLVLLALLLSFTLLFL